METGKLIRGLIVGFIMAVGGIGLFLFLYFSVFAGAGSTVRLFASLIIPPVVMFFLVVGYFILTQDEPDNSGEEED